MTEEQGGKIHIDSDWKNEAQQEKERLAAEERAAAEKQGEGGQADMGNVDPHFAELVNLIAMQTLVALGAMQGADGQAIPPNPQAAKHFIDLMETLQRKTEGNLTEDEKKVLDTVVYELRMSFVQTMQPPPGGAPGDAPEAGS